MHKQKIIKKYKFKISGTFRNSEIISRYGFYLPSGIGTTNQEIKFICNKLNQILK